MSNCLAERVCDRAEVQEGEDVPSWEAIVAAIRASAANRGSESAGELIDWAEFVEGCGHLWQKR